MITGIEREHVDLLGTRLGGIAVEKAGVMRPGVPCVIGAVRPAARRALAARAPAVGAAPVWAEREASWTVTGQDARGVRVDLATPRAATRACASGSSAATRRATRRSPSSPPSGSANWVAVPPAAVRAGLAAARWPGRCDYRPGARALLLDGSHTEGSARALAALLDELFPGRRIALVFGALRDKRVGAMAAALFPRAARAPRAPAGGAGLEPDELLRRVPARAARALPPRAGVAEALPRRAARAGPRGLVVVAGSLFLVGEAIAVEDAGTLLNGRPRVVRELRCRPPPRPRRCLCPGAAARAAGRRAQTLGAAGPPAACRRRRCRARRPAKPPVTLARRRGPRLGRAPRAHRAERSSGRARS